MAGKKIYVEYNAIIKAIHDDWDDVCNWDASGSETADEVERSIACVPAANVAPVVHAQWIKCGDNQPMSCDNVYCCSNCKGNKRLEWHLKPFCEDCGARMDANEST